MGPTRDNHTPPRSLERDTRELESETTRALAGGGQ